MSSSGPQAQISEQLLAQRRQDDGGKRLKGVLRCVSETVVQEPTLASLIFRVAVDELLLNQR